MNKFIRYTFPLLLALMPAMVSALNIRDLRYEITDTAIVFPESTQTDVHKLQHNWYLQNYTVLERETSPTAGDMSDETIIKNLQAIPTTIEMPFNSVVKNHIDLYVNRRRSLVEAMLGMSLYYMPIFEEALEREGLPLELKYLPVIESALNPDAVSRAGATGIWQFMLPTAKGLGMEVTTLVDERRDPVASSAAAAKYLKQLYGIFNDWGLAIAAYNCGPGNINKALSRAGASADNPKDYWQIYYYLPAETRGYVPGFIGATYAMTHYADHGISPSLARRPILTDTVHVNSRLHFNSISQILNIPVEELQVLNPQYRQRIIPGDIKPYALRLPSQLVYNYLLLEDSIIAESAKLAPRSVVELSQQTQSSAGGSREVTKWHKVRRGETLGSIARKYGVTERQIRRWNGLKSSKVARGRNLKIVVKEAVPEEPKPAPAADTQGQVDVVYEDPDQQPAETEVSDAAEAAAAVVAGAEPSEADVRLADDPEPEYEEGAPQQAEPVKEAKPAPKTRIHKVSKGDTLYSISRKYGVTVQAIQKANNMSGSALSIDQRLKIPVK
ncbi:MAG: LysM peptidoglycan-binding domain-containing protein [Bacteroides sp.]|nr:LysM peptidoglycan-binding domain-containing protein [Bacteroides sp.]